MATRGTLRARQGVAAASLACLLVACGQVGGATTRIDAAEEEVERIVDAITDEIGLQVTFAQPLGSRARCELATGEGASNTLARRGPLEGTVDAIDRAASILVDRGYELVASPDLGEGVFGRRDGIRITVFVDVPTRQLAIDAATGCRPLPR